MFWIGGTHKHVMLREPQHDMNRTGYKLTQLNQNCHPEPVEGWLP